ncbi:MAG: D-beta-D-heptose 7-phosphate kinase/D-beta-D-heptose 1-phosphate adenosyltransferase [Bacteroidia bacterium]|jgi:D-beta-D-heptose 7-phosphate kinase/D-beta-D-heptose 1-phosphate adenosyltransferase
MKSSNHISKLESKIYDLSTLKDRVERLHASKKTVVFTNGCFDLIHKGHIDYLNRAADLGDFLILGLNSDASVQRLKGTHRPLQNQESRSYIMAALDCIDAVVIFDEDTPIELITTLKPNVLVKGGDYTEATVVGADLVKSYSGSVQLLPFLDGFSTSNIEKKIRGNS